jgi:hypothetical protein
MIEPAHDLAITKQAKALNISRGSVYYLPRPVPEADFAIMRRLDRLHLEFPFAGSRMLRGLLAAEGCKIGRRHVKTLMKRMGIEALYRRPRTTKPEPDHKIYPYLLRGMEIVRPNQVWAMDITYIPMEHIFRARCRSSAIGKTLLLGRQRGGRACCNSLRRGGCIRALPQLFGPLLGLGIWRAVGQFRDGRRAAAHASMSAVKLATLTVSAKQPRRASSSGLAKQSSTALYFPPSIDWPMHRRKVSPVASEQVVAALKQKGRPCRVDSERQISMFTNT